MSEAVLPCPPAALPPFGYAWLDRGRAFRVYSLMRFDAVAFDLDGTLYPASSLFTFAFPGMLGNMRLLAAFSASRRRMRELGSDAEYRRAPPKDSAAFHAHEASIVAERLGIGATEAAARMELLFYRNIEELFSGLRPYRGLEEALDALAAGGLRLALLSDLPPERKLELLGLGGRFEVALCSEDSGFLKPAGEPFAMLASALALPPERILYVGNNPAIDVRGAKAAGMSAAIVSRLRVPGADLSFRDWRRLVDFALA